MQRDIEDDLEAGIMVRDELVPQAVMLYCGEDSGVAKDRRQPCTSICLDREKADEKNTASAEHAAHNLEALHTWATAPQQEQQQQQARAKTKDKVQHAIQDWADSAEREDKLRRRKSERRRRQRSQERSAGQLFVGNVVYTQRPPPAVFEAAGGAKEARAQRAGALLRLLGPHAVRLHGWHDQLHVVNARQHVFVVYDSPEHCAAALERFAHTTAAQWADAYSAAIAAGTPPWALPALPLRVASARPLR